MLSALRILEFERTMRLITIRRCSGLYTLDTAMTLIKSIVSFIVTLFPFIDPNSYLVVCVNAAIFENRCQGVWQTANCSSPTATIPKSIQQKCSQILREEELPGYQSIDSRM